MKKRALNIIILCLIFILPMSVNSLEVTTANVTAEANLRIRKGPGTSYEQIGSAIYNTNVRILSFAESGNGCADRWAQIETLAGVQGYVCSTYLDNIVTQEISEEELNNQNEISNQGQAMANMTEEEFEAYLTSQGFPESYKVKLRELHRKHPTWIFKGIRSKYSWLDALNAEDTSGTSLMNVNPTYANNGYEGYLSISEADYNHDTDKFIAHDGTYWFQANRQTIAYYMDPRNFLDEKQIFMFEELFYYPTYQTIDVVNSTLSSAFLRQFAQLFIKAAQESQVSPVYLASLSKQEVGTSNTNICTNGNAGVLSDGVNYSGYYNFFNIGASSSSDPKLKSLKYAKSVGWNTPEKAIVEGSKIISNNYVNCGQYTSYFQKFNVAITATKGTWHQYTTNITALVSPAVSTYNAYLNHGLIEKDFVFAIPIFTGMPDTTTLPRLGNPNNWLKTLKVNNSLVSNFDNDKLNYTVNVPYSESIRVDATTVSTKATVTGTGVIPLTGETTIHNVVVTAQNGSVKTYKLTIVREAPPVVDDNQNGNPPVDSNDNNGNPPTPGDDNNNNGNGNDNGNVTPIVDDNNGNGNDNNDNNGQDIEIINTIDLDDVIKAANYKFNKYLTNITLGTTVKTITDKLTLKYPTVTVNIVDSSNKPKTSGAIVTGDKITISSNGDTKTVQVVIYGDIDGNGTITVADLLYAQKQSLGYTKLTGCYYTAADVNKDNKITVVDILAIQKHLLKVQNISQG